MMILAAIEPLTREQSGALPRDVGAQLRACRKVRRWSLKRLQAEMFSRDRDHDEKSWQALGAYERGARTISLETFLIWCVALDQHPGDLLMRAMNSVTGAEYSSKAPECGMRVDVFALAHSDDPPLRAASRWATALIKHHCAGESALVVLDEYAMTQLVRASGVARPDLVRALHRVAYTPPT